MEKIEENIRKVLESKTAVRILYVIGIFIIVMLIFSAGIIVGFHKASFGHAWEENYEHNFGMIPNRPMLGEDNFPNAHGAIGKIIKIELPTIIVADKDNTEKVVLLKDDTKIEKMKMQIKSSDLAIDDFIVVIGSPSDKGQIEAKFIRVMPAGIPVLPPQAPTQ